MTTAADDAGCEIVVPTQERLRPDIQHAQLQSERLINVEETS
jgi:hypothetical protein